MSDEEQNSCRTDVSVPMSRLYSTRTMYNLRSPLPACGPIYDNRQHLEPWGVLGPLSKCGSLKNSARQVYTAELRETGRLVSKVMKTTYICRCGCEAEVPYSGRTTSESTSLPQVFARKVLNGTNSFGMTAYDQLSSAYFAQW